MNSPKFLDSQIRDVEFGRNVTVVKPVNLYECKIGDHTFIGPFVEIQRGVSVGYKCKIQSHSFICELVSIGNECFIGHGVIFINDTFNIGRPANRNNKLWKKTEIKDNVSIGNNATLMPVKITKNVVIGAGAVVTKDIKRSGIYAGNPARLIREI
jgi:acetyltransferase-like isoleucine patch superfamily enzyme